MSGKGIEELLEAGAHLYAALERETLDCLTKVGTSPVEEIERFVARRQEILADIQKFDTELALLLCRVSSNAQQSQRELEEFRERQCVWIRRVIEADRLLLALAQMEKGKLRSALSAIATGRLALHGYGTNERRPEFFQRLRA